MTDEYKSPARIYRVELLVIDHDIMTDGEIEDQLENVRNLFARVMEIESCDVAWHDDHPLNKTNSQKKEFRKLFTDPAYQTQARAEFDELEAENERVRAAETERINKQMEKVEYEQYQELHKKYGARRSCYHDWVVPRMPGAHLYCAKCGADGGANDG